MAVRLGDVIDDHCSRCRRIMDHSVVAMVGDEVKRVRCRICNDEHNFRHGESPKKKPKAKLSAFDEVLASITAGMPGAPPAQPPEKPKREMPARKSMRTAATRRVMPKR